MQPEIDLFGLPLKTFGLCFALGFVAAGAIIQRRLRELGRPIDWAYEITFAALAGGLVGSRLYYVVTHTDELSDDVLGTLFGSSGLVWYGGALGGALAVLAWARYRGMLERTLLDVCAIPLALGYAIGRVGCQLSGDGDYGRPWDGPWAMAYPDGVVPTDIPVHPTPVYEALAMGLVAWVLWRNRHAFRPGVIFGLYLLAAGTERFLVELVRRNDPGLLGLTDAQFTSLGLVVAGLVWLALDARKPGGLRGGRRADVPRGRV
ncbi:MAG: prolipoprotein diacylglyceryl transferase, partial [Solirubrobacterales bacterium]|nr:prolipoprotein diacylglyceryl transferase [Solirubrobacterales bacterium]